MTKKLRVRFVIISMVALLLMQSMIVCFSAQRSYHNLIEKSDTTINTIKEAHPESASVDARYFAVTVFPTVNAVVYENESCSDNVFCAFKTCFGFCKCFFNFDSYFIADFDV